MDRQTCGHPVRPDVRTAKSRGQTQPQSSAPVTAWVAPAAGPVRPASVAEMVLARLSSSTSVIEVFSGRAQACEAARAQGWAKRQVRLERPDRRDPLAGRFPGWARRIVCLSDSRPMHGRVLPVDENAVISEAIALARQRRHAVAVCRDGSRHGHCGTEAVAAVATPAGGCIWGAAKISRGIGLAGAAEAAMGRWLRPSFDGRFKRRASARELWLRVMTAMKDGTL